MRNFKDVCRSIMTATDNEFLKHKVDQILELSFLRASELRIDDWRALQDAVIKTIFSGNKNSENITRSELNVLAILTDQSFAEMQRIFVLKTEHSIFNLQN